MAAAVFLLPLHEEADTTGKAAEGRQVRLDAPHARHQLALVVGDAARVKPSVADLRLIRRGRPQLVRHRRLHVVVLDGVERHWPVPDLPDHQWRDVRIARELDRINPGPQPIEALGYPFGGSAEGRKEKSYSHA